MVMRWRERISSVCLFALFCFAFIYSRSFPAVPQILPTGITLLGMLLCLILFVRTFLIKYNDEAKMTPEKVAEQKAAAVKVLKAIVMLVVYVALIRVIGFYVISFVFMNCFAYIVDSEKHKLWMYPVVSIGVLAVIYGIFSLFLNVPLPTGILF